MVTLERYELMREEAATAPRSKAFGITTDWVIFAIFVAGLAWVPYWLGSNRLIAWGINAVLFGGLAAVYELSLLMRSLSHPVPINRVKISAVLLALVFAWIILQNAIWTPSPWQHPNWGLAADVLSFPVEGSISVDRDLTAI